MSCKGIPCTWRTCALSRPAALYQSLECRRTRLAARPARGEALGRARGEPLAWPYATAGRFLTRVAQGLVAGEMTIDSPQSPRESAEKSRPGLTSRSRATADTSHPRELIEDTSCLNLPPAPTRDTDFTGAPGCCRSLALPGRGSG